jgi:hypothetical protein
MNQNIYLCFVFASFINIVFGQSSTTCSNSNLLMTPTVRQQILDYLNEARGKLENGQLLLNNGKYALKAESLSELTWDCETEERIYDWLEDTCIDNTLRWEEQRNMTWYYSKYNFNGDDNNANVLVSDMLVDFSSRAGYYNQQFARHTIHLNNGNTFAPYSDYNFALSDKAQHVGCAIQHCHKNWGPGYPEFTIDQIYCQIPLSEDLKFGDEIYKVAPSVNYIPPTQDVMCESGTVTIEDREEILRNINEARTQISQGTYQVGNGNALQSATPLLPLHWSCQDEYALMNPLTYCSDSMIDVEKDFDYMVQAAPGVLTRDTLFSWFTQLGTEFFVSNPNFNFLSQSTTYSTTYPAAFALSDAAESIACTRRGCFNSATGSMTHHHICRVNPSIPDNTNLYQSV